MDGVTGVFLVSPVNYGELGGEGWALAILFSSHYTNKDFCYLRVEFYR